MQKAIKLISVVIIFSVAFFPHLGYAQTYRPIPNKIQAESWDAKSGSQYANGTGDADGWNFKFFIKFMKSGKSSIAADGNQGINAMFLQLIKCLLSSSFCFEFFASG